MGKKKGGSKKGSSKKSESKKDSKRNAGKKASKVRPPKEDIDRISGKSVYGSTLLMRLEYIENTEGPDEVKRILRAMKDEGYTGPKKMSQISASKKYPLKDLIALLHTYKAYHGQENLREMSYQIAAKSGFAGLMLQFFGKPEKIIQDTEDHWREFYCFGKLEGGVSAPQKAVLIGTDICCDELFDQALAYNFEGILRNMKVKDTLCEHYKCELRGDKHGEWILTWD